MTDEEFLVLLKTTNFNTKDFYESKLILAGMEITPNRIDIMVDHAVRIPNGSLVLAIALATACDLSVPQLSKLFLRFPDQIVRCRNLKPVHIEHILFRVGKKYHSKIALAHTNCTDAMRVRYNLMYGAANDR